MTDHRAQSGSHGRSLASHTYSCSPQSCRRNPVPPSEFTPPTPHNTPNFAYDSLSGGAKMGHGAVPTVSSMQSHRVRRLRDEKGKSAPGSLGMVMSGAPPISTPDSQAHESCLWEKPPHRLDTDLEHKQPPGGHCLCPVRAATHLSLSPSPQRPFHSRYYFLLFSTLIKTP